MIKLYTFATCPYCEKVRQAFEEMGIDYEEIPSEPGTAGSASIQELTGKGQVPFLVIEKENGDVEHFMHESDLIIEYVREHYAQ